MSDDADEVADLGINIILEENANAGNVPTQDDIQVSSEIKTKSN